MPGSHHGVGFIAAPHQDIESGDYDTVPADLILSGWNCASCGKDVEFDPPRVFAAVVDQAMAHERTCPSIPREC